MNRFLSKSISNKPFFNAQPPKTPPKTSEMFRFVLCLSVAVAAAVPLHYEQEHHYAPNYSYKYAVKDLHTHDMKSQWETRHGDKVQGSYRLVEPDGSVRIVDYVADGHNGFRAVVTKEKHGHREVTVHGKEKSELGFQREEGYGAVSQVQSHLGGEYGGEYGVSNFGGVGYGLEGGAISEGYGHYYN